jgi:hypothetical protein
MRSPLKLVANHSEAYSNPAKLAEQVRKIGFAEVSDFGPDEANARYFKDRTDGLRTYPLNTTCERGLAPDHLRQRQFAHHRTT